jgi:membrane dipeptidase
MDRRDFNLSLVKVAAGTILARRLTAYAAPDGSSSANALYSNAVVIDSLCAPFLDSNLSGSQAPDAIAAVRKSGITAINFTIATRDFEETLNTLANAQKLVDDHPEMFLIVRRYSDLARCKREDKLGLMLGFQDTAFLEQDPDRIDLFRKLGVRIMQIAYNVRNKFADGCLDLENTGLTTAGQDVIWKMNVLGVALDLSHSGYRTMSEGIARSNKPVLISHSGCAGVYAHPRNTPDDILKLLADRGGYFGVYFTPYLVASPIVPTREHVLDHLLHAINVCGADHVGIGSDCTIQKIVLTPEMKAAFDKNFARRKEQGIGAPGEDRYPYVPDLNGPDHMQVIADELEKRGQPDQVVEKVLGANFQRVIGEIWGKA